MSVFSLAVLVTSDAGKFADVPGKIERRIGAQACFHGRGRQFFFIG
jgi:hypothetical protein